MGDTIENIDILYQYVLQIKISI